MSKFVSFLKTTLIGGALVVLPAWLAVLLLVKALMHLTVFVKPVSSHLPESISHPRIIAIALMVTVCFVMGAAIRTAVGRNAKLRLETNVLEKLPGYIILRNVARQLGDLEQNHGFKPALVEIEEALAPCFIVEEHADGRFTVFIPSAPTPAAGTILIVPAPRVHPVNVPVATMFSCVTKWGTGSSGLLAAMENRSATQAPNPSAAINETPG